MRRNKNETGAASFGSLYTAFIYVLLLAMLCSLLLFLIVDLCATAYVDNRLLPEDKREEREADFVSELSEFARSENISMGSVDRLSDRIREEKYVFVMIYHGENLVLDSGAAGGASGRDEADWIRSGITVTYPTRAQLESYAEGGVRYSLRLTDGELGVYVADFTEYFYYDLINISSTAAAAAAFFLVIMLYFHSVTGRLRRLALDVTAIAEGDINREIAEEGEDEIGRLSIDVENMRSSLVETLAKERAAVEANNELITSMSHDLRTPLTVLLGYLDMMKLCADGNETLGDYIKASEKTAMRMKAMSDDMFNYFLVFGRDLPQADIQDYDAATLVDQLLSEHVLLLSERGYNVMVSGREGGALGSLKIRTDAPSLMRIIENLFSNITKYAEMSAPVSIAIKTERVDGKDGQTEKLKLLFTNTTRRDGASAESNRIGLKTCKKIAGAIGVDFNVYSDHKVFTAEISVPTVGGAGSERD